MPALAFIIKNSLHLYTYNILLHMRLKQQNFERLIDDVYKTHHALQENAKKVINQNLTIRNWLVGCYIVEYEQNGEDRAKYGTKLLEKMAKSLKSKGIKGLRSRELNTCRKFYVTYSQIWRSVSAKLQTNDNLQVNLKSIDIREIPRTASAKSNDEIEIAPELLLSRLSYSHFVELIRVEVPLERLFYEIETIKNNWGVRELERAIDTSLYFRTGLSINKEAVIARIKNIKPESNIDIIRNPYVLEFLGLEEKSEYSESDLEQAILTHLQKFLMELGTGFCFEARQKRITFDNTHYLPDLLFKKNGG